MRIILIELNEAIEGSTLLLVRGAGLVLESGEASDGGHCKRVDGGVGSSWDGGWAEER